MYRKYATIKTCDHSGVYFSLISKYSGLKVYASIMNGPQAATKTPHASAKVLGVDNPKHNIPVLQIKIIFVMTPK